MTCTSRTSFNVLPTYISTYLRTYIVISKCPSSSSPLKDRFFKYGTIQHTFHTMKDLFEIWKNLLRDREPFFKIFHLLRMWLFFYELSDLDHLVLYNFFNMSSLSARNLSMRDISSSSKSFAGKCFSKMQWNNYLKWPRDW